MIQNIEKKIKLALAISVGSFVTSLIIVGLTFVFAYSLVNEQRKNIYVLDHNVPVLVRQTEHGTNREVEYESHVNMFHLLFFTLPPDDEYIKNNLNKAMYLVDDTGLAQYNNLREKGYYNSILASSALLTIQTDSITVDENGHFTYYAKQRIERPTSIATRALITEGDLQDVSRTDNNPHGLIIKNWKTVLNKDLKYVEKKNF
ncbi:conjugative transposon protein TraK [Pontibacter diazotrophicus]|uniref:Conjugative transposon protein TraK n=1 Tax=Pontibacter diazotrophicus TaxID=1400979 RepID=A0A3D8L3E2_9BACT|nr:conjugative transposon protein TraK [Pontibacter diazotrophicus]RDV11890.1 conjugative transposon protein TraK [Pontibacter diazotrophicus]